MRKINSTLTARAMTWPVMSSNGMLLCALTLEDDEDTWYCWGKLVEAPDDPGELAEFSPALLAVRIIQHIKEFHPS